MNATVQRKDHGGDDCHAIKMAALLIPCLLRQLHISKRRYGHGKSGALHHPGVILPRAYAVPGLGGAERDAITPW